MIKFKNDKYYLELISNEVRPEIRMLVAVIGAWLDGHGIDLVITSVLGEKGVQRKSSTHKTGRAVDISVKCLQDTLTDKIEGQPFSTAKSLTKWINTRFSTGVEFENEELMQVAVYHDSGYGKHIHIQVAKGRPLIINSEKGGILL